MRTKILVRNTKMYNSMKEKWQARCTKKFSWNKSLRILIDLIDEGIDSGSSLFGGLSVSPSPIAFFGTSIKPWVSLLSLTLDCIWEGHDSLHDTQGMMKRTRREREEDEKRTKRVRPVLRITQRGSFAWRMTDVSRISFQRKNSIMFFVKRRKTK